MLKRLWRLHNFDGYIIVLCQFLKLKRRSLRQKCNKTCLHTLTANIVFEQKVLQSSYEQNGGLTQKLRQKTHLFLRKKVEII